MSNDTSGLAAEPVRFEQIPHWILEHPQITGNAVRLYLQLRKYAGKDHRAWPGRKRLASDLNLSIRTIDAAKDVLAAIGAIEIEQRPMDDKNYQSNLYTVRWTDKNCTPPSAESAPPPVQKVDHPQCRNGGTNLYPDNSYPVETYKDAASEQNVDGFDEFWAAYPRRIGKKAALKAWINAIKTVDPQTIVNATAEFSTAVAGKETQYIAHPSTWLNEGRWDDDMTAYKTQHYTNRDRNLARADEFIANAQQAENVWAITQEQRREIEQ